MITLTRVDGTKITINVDEIEFYQTIHETTVSLISGRKIIVKENSEEITEKVIKFKQACFQKAFST
ncbi:MAG: flagellar FlbD family protein [Ignavibacteria bacterium]|jgi:flagellar protein FlbD|nr:flagellar FlbD family protein [Ignavibacteria bacterium]